MTPDDLRALAYRLERRRCAASLEGYELADGLRAAADLLEGKPGPLVHPTPIFDEFRAMIPLAEYARQRSP